MCLAAILQAIVAKIWKLRRDNLTFRVYPTAMIEENKWRAVRFGLDGKLIDFGKEQELPARELITEMLQWFVDDVVDELGSRREVEYAFEIMRGGTSADRQLAMYRADGRPRTVVDRLVSETAEGVRPEIAKRFASRRLEGEPYAIIMGTRDPATRPHWSSVMSWRHIAARRPIVGIPTQTLQSLGGVSAEIPPSWVMSQRYILTLTNGGRHPVDDPARRRRDAARRVRARSTRCSCPAARTSIPRPTGASRTPLRQDGPRARSRRVALARWAMEEASRCSASVAACS